MFQSLTISNNPDVHVFVGMAGYSRQPPLPDGAIKLCQQVMLFSVGTGMPHRTAASAVLFVIICCWLCVRIAVVLVVSALVLFVCIVYAPFLFLIYVLCMFIICVIYILV